ncbi:condensation domain-containing protein [Colwellia psychrerythraea]|uniref:Aspartate racemase n=1 Tax=Colwellia psychrerythraea TaxID=28229 RepID=A0A099KB95_COLPS|nr:condensation domain-containing protein [Colwellia psychrerythraea]KGJ87337.1 Aspartate racemase [Colwellia psychrerythraea]
MSLADSIIEQAQAHNILLYLKGSQLAYISEEGAFPDQLKGLIRDNKDSIVASLLQQELKKQLEDKASVITVVEKDQFLPLSFAQQGLWFIDKLEGGSSQYNIHAAFRLTGKLNLAAMQNALDTLVERHEVLRTVFIEKYGEACQVIQPALPVEIPVLDLSVHAKDKQQDKVLEFATIEMNKAFDLQSDLMLRAKILVLSQQEHVLLFTMHHIASDGWSQGILISEFVTLYNSSCKKLPNPLPALEIQFSDYAHWQRCYFSDEKIAQQLVFWKNRLAGAPRHHSLPLDRPRKPQQDFNGKIYTWLVEADSMNALKGMAKANNATLFMVLYTALSVVFGRWSQTRDVVIGSPIAGRTHHQVAPLIGYFLNSIVYRSQWSEGESFASLLDQNRKHTLEAYDNQDIPFDALVDKMKTPRELSHSPLFQLMFTLQNHEKSELNLTDLTIQGLIVESSITKYEMQIVAEEFNHGIGFSLTYSTHLFDEQTIQAITDSFNLVLRQIANNADLIIDRIKLSSVKTELSEIKPTQSNTVHGLFEQLAAQKGDDIAITFQTSEISYLQLNARANRLARYLLAQGIKTGETIFVGFENNINCYIALLAILKAGGMYRYYDPSRHESLLNNFENELAGKKILIEPGYMAQIPVSVIIMPEIEQLSGYSDGNIDPVQTQLNGLDSAIGDSINCDSLLSHENACSQINRQQTQMALTTRSSLLILPETAYFCVTQWLAGLTAGAKLVLVGPQHNTAKILVQKAVTHATFTPAILADLSFNDAYKLERIAVTSEPSCTSLLWQWAQSYSVISVLNTGVFSYVSVCSIDSNKSVNLGKVCDTALVKILDYGGAPTPAGAIGDLYIDGIKKEPASSNNDNGLYDTGMKVRQLNDCALELISCDDKGITRNVLELEYVISCQSLVEQVAICNGVVFVRFKVSSIECSIENTDKVSWLKNRIKEILPHYMLPEIYMSVDKMPLLINAEVNRQLLGLQIDYWNNEVKYFPDADFFPAAKSVEVTRKSAPFVLTDQSVKALEILASHHNVSMAMVLAAIFPIALSLHIDSNVVVNAVYGLSADDMGKIFVHNKLEDSKSVDSIVNESLNNIYKTLPYGFVEQQWITNKYNQVHRTNVTKLFDYMLSFKSLKADGEQVSCNDNMDDFSIVLQINNVEPGKFDGIWNFDDNKFDLAAITRLASTLNLLILNIKEQKKLTLMMLKDKLKQETRSKIRLAKRKFMPLKSR